MQKMLITVHAVNVEEKYKRYGPFWVRVPRDYKEKNGSLSNYLNSFDSIKKVKESMRSEGFTHFAFEIQQESD